MTLHLKTEAGDEIMACALLAHGIARTLGVAVQFEHNGVTCSAHPDGDSETLVRRWNEARALPSGHLRMAYSRQ